MNAIALLCYLHLNQFFVWYWVLVSSKYKMKKTVVFQTLFHRLENLYFNTYDKVSQMIPTMVA